MAFLPDDETNGQNPAQQEEGGAESGSGPALTDAEMKKYTRSRFADGMLLGALIVLILMIVLTAGWMTARSLLRKTSGNVEARILTDSSTSAKLREIEAIIEDDYLGDVDSDRLSAYMFKGLALGLDDEYASYYTEEELASVQDSTRGEYYGIGATIGRDTQEDSFYVSEVYEGSPAEEGGLLEDDRILAIDGQTTAGLDLNELVSLIKSKETFTMEVYRPISGEEIELTLSCADVEPPYVSSKMLTERIGYIRLTEFTSSAVDQFSGALDTLAGQGMEKLIVDLRGNPGGLLSAVCDMLDELLPEGLIVYTEDKAGNRVEYSADDEQSTDCELAVLVDGESASASEIFAGAVQDAGRGLVIGTQTYGKGVVQKTYTLSDGSAFKLTVENYYTPSGREINGNGIEPDIVVGEDGEEDASLARALQYFEEEEDG